MSKSYRDYTVEEVYQMKGYWLSGDADQMKMLLHIHTAMMMFGSSTTDIKLLPVFGEGDTNKLMCDYGKINEIIGMGKQEKLTNFMSDLELSNMSINPFAADVAELMGNYVSARRASSRLLNQYHEAVETVARNKSAVDAALAADSSAMLVAKVRAVEAKSTFVFIGARGRELRFIQRMPTVLADIDLESGHNLSQDMGRYILSITVEDNGSCSRLNVSAGYQTIWAKSRRGLIYIHPNISSGGRICFGDGNADYSLALANSDYAELASLADRTLRTMSTGTPYIPFERLAASNSRKACDLSSAQLDMLGLEDYDYGDATQPNTDPREAVVMSTDEAVYVRQHEEFPLLYVTNSGRYFREDELDFDVEDSEEEDDDE